MTMTTEQKPRTIEKPSDLEGLMPREKVTIPGYVGAYQLWKQDNDSFQFIRSLGKHISLITINNQDNKRLTFQHRVYSEVWNDNKIYDRAKAFLAGEQE